jgi:CubicO group peptidase (beta-lactamase class C family)
MIQDNLIVQVETGLAPEIRIPGKVEHLWNVLERMKEHHTPGFCVAVIDHGQVAWIRSYGSIEAGRSAAVTADTHFPIGCMSELFTGLAALQLAAQGKLDLDQDVNQILASWKLPDAEGRVTTARLLSHLGGINVPGFPGYAEDDPIPTLLQILDGVPPAKNSPLRITGTPGQYQYSSGGFAIVQQVLVDLTGIAFPDLMRELVFDPFGMARSGYEPLPAGWFANTARGHREDGTVLPGYWYTYPEMAASGMFSTCADVARAMAAIHVLYHGRPLPGVPAEVVVEMVRRRIGPHGPGCKFHGEGDTFTLRSEGFHAGHRCLAGIYPTLGKGAVFMTNGGYSTDLIIETMRSISVAYNWPDFHPREMATTHVHPEYLAAMAGQYDAGGCSISIRSADGRIFWQFQDEAEKEIFPASEEELALSDGRLVTVEKGPDGRVVALRLIRDAHQIQATRVNGA